MYFYPFSAHVIVQTSELSSTRAGFNICFLNGNLNNDNFVERKTFKKSSWNLGGAGKNRKLVLARLGFVLRRPEAHRREPLLLFLLLLLHWGRGRDWRSCGRCGRRRRRRRRRSWRRRRRRWRWWWRFARYEAVPRIDSALTGFLPVLQKLLLGFSRLISLKRNFENDFKFF